VDTTVETEQKSTTSTSNNTPIDLTITPTISLIESTPSTLISTPIEIDAATEFSTLTASLLTAPPPSTDDEEYDPEENMCISTPPYDHDESLYGDDTFGPNSPQHTTEDSLP
jgi:hypothetical protein